MLTVYCFLSPRSSHLTPIPVKPTPFLQISFLDSHLIVIVIGPLSWTNTICVVSGLELSSEAWWTHCLVQCKQQLSLHKNLSITNSSARSWSKSSWLITEPWLANNRPSCEAPGNWNCCKVCLQWLCHTWTTSSPIPLPSSHLLMLPTLWNTVFSELQKRQCKLRDVLKNAIISHQFKQPWVSVFVAIHYNMKFLWLMVRIILSMSIDRNKTVWCYVNSTKQK